MAARLRGVHDRRLQVQADIAARVAQALGPGAGGQHAAAARGEADPPPGGVRCLPEGHRALSRGANPTTLRQAVEQFEQAVALDTAFAPAWARLSQSASLLWPWARRRRPWRSGPLRREPGHRPRAQSRRGVRGSRGLLSETGARLRSVRSSRTTRGASGRSNAALLRARVSPKSSSAGGTPRSSTSSRPMRSIRDPP